MPPSNPIICLPFLQALRSCAQLPSFRYLTRPHGGGCRLHRMARTAAGGAARISGVEQAQACPGGPLDALIKPEMSVLLEIVPIVNFRTGLVREGLVLLLAVIHVLLLCSVPLKAYLDPLAPWLRDTDNVQALYVGNVFWQRDLHGSFVGCPGPGFLVCGIEASCPGVSIKALPQKPYKTDLSDNYGATVTVLGQKCTSSLADVPSNPPGAKPPNVECNK